MLMLRSAIVGVVHTSTDPLRFSICQKGDREILNWLDIGKQLKEG